MWSYCRQEYYMEYGCHIFSKYLVFQIKKASISIKKIPSISIEILGIMNQKFWNTYVIIPWIWNTRYFEWNT